MKNGKSMGPDSIINEMLKYRQHVLVQPIMKLFNLVLLSGKYPSSWSEGYIVPIFKTDNQLNPENYRGITITCSLGKLFNIVINSRLAKFLSQNNVIIKEQIGFEKGCRTSDHMFIIKTLIDKYKKEGRKLYCAFVNFRKAFDSVVPCILLHKLQQYGVKGYLYNIIKDMYVHAQSNLRVKVGNKLTEEFVAYRGVRQGDPLSPNLFNLYVNDVKTYFDSNCDPAHILNEQVNCLLYADDLVLLSETELGLQTCIDRLQNFCRDSELQVNSKKTKIMVFNSRNANTPEIYLGGEQLQVVDSYKYLGLLLRLMVHLRLQHKTFTIDQ